MTATRIQKVSLDAFKGLAREYELAPATLLVGPNGAGKSACLEGITYALTGRVPAGRALDAVAQYFPARGGTVQVTDADGRWISRGIERDHKRKAVSERLEAPSHGGSETPDLTPWQASEIVLDVRAFLALSPAKRREYVIQLCGGGELDVDELLGGIALAYAREVAGPAAGLGTLEDPSDLPDAERELCEAWRSARIHEELLSYAATADGTAARLCQELATEAKSSRLACRKAKIDAESAMRELEAEAKGARAAAAEIATRRRAVEDLQEELTNGREEVARYEEAQRAAASATANRKRAEDELLEAMEAAEAIADPGERPTPPGPRDLRPLEQAVSAAAEHTMALRGELESRRLVHRRIADVREHIAASEEALTQHRSSPVGQAYELVQGIPDDAHRAIAELKELLAKAAEVWLKQRETMEHEHEDLEEDRRKAIEKLRAFALLDDLVEQIQEAEAQEAAAVDAYTAAQQANDRATAAYEQRHADWQRAAEVYRQAQAAVPGAEKNLNHWTKEEAERAAHAKSVATDADVDAIQVKLYKAQEALKKAEEAAGAVKAYEAALERARVNTLGEAAWKVAEKAITSAREQYVGAASKGLIDDINEVLERASREERAYLELENERGKPIFELGWIRGESKTSLAALSAGEAVLFCAALSLAIIRRSPGRKILLVEADPLDSQNLLSLLAVLGRYQDELDALVVATASHVPADIDGWRVCALNGAGRETHAVARS